jgi:regulator of protease activity HflC (stomatin/prohibitin superfamily)
VVSILAAWLLVSFLTIYIPIGKVGVLTKEYRVFGEQGVIKKDFKPGWHWNIKPIHNWDLFDSTVQTLEMTKEPQHGSQPGRDNVEVQSADGYAVSVDVTVKYRIVDGEAYKLRKLIGKGDKYKSIVRTNAQKACLSLFGEMKTEDFYNPYQRRTKEEGIKKLLSAALKDNSMEIIDVLVRDVQFDPEYEKKIQRKKLADQEVQLNISMAKAEEKKGKTQVIEAETKRKLNIIRQNQESELVRMEAGANREIAKIKADYEKYSTQKKADADLIAARQEAEGQLLVKTAEAQGEKLRNQAMQGVGGSTIVALEAAKNLNFGNMTISTLNVDILDLDEMATKLGVPESK